MKNELQFPYLCKRKEQLLVHYTVTKLIMCTIGYKKHLVVDRHEPILLHNNAKPYVSQTTVLKLSELSYELLSHPH